RMGVMGPAPVYRLAVYSVGAGAGFTQPAAAKCQLGLNNADMLSSPKLRTRQTAHFILGQAVASEDWLEGCDNQFASEALSRKRPGHNLVLVTHNGCIDHFARQQNVTGGERQSGYASALFVSVDGNGKARILGRLNEPDWQRVLASTAK
ncbi:MAG: hypothetical protein ACN6PL_03350, partial [Pseudomonas putida]